LLLRIGSDFILLYPEYTLPGQGGATMDEFLTTYIIFLVFGAICFLLFWGAVIYFIVRFFRSKSGLSTQQKMDILAKGMSAYSGGRGGSGSLMDTQAGSVAASQGIDLDK
jgi:hypothetical protein